jgi:PEP-CTERM/exosortase A-associated glycosyltransferase
MRVLHVLDHSVPLHSGYSFRTLAILREQRKLGIETFHVTSPKHTAPGPPVEDVEGFRFHRTAPASGFLSRAPVAGEMRLMAALERRVDALAAEIAPDVIHAHSPVLDALPAIRAGRRRGIPVVYEVRAFWEDAAVDHGTSREWGLRYRATRAAETRALRRADHVTTICEGLRGDIVARGIPESRVTVIPNAVDPSEFRTAAAPDAALVRKLGLEDARVIGFIGSFYAYEGLALLLAALPPVRERLPDVKLLLVGGGPEDAALRAQVAASGLGGAVVFTGRVPHEDVPRHYDLIQVLVYPRLSMRLTELVTPLKPLEAMAQGRLVVASDVGGHRELIADRRTGILFPAGDPRALASAVVDALEAPDGASAIRREARAFVENERTWAKSVARYVPIYEALSRKSARDPVAR